jgi:hypothetical protein
MSTYELKSSAPDMNLFKAILNNNNELQKEHLDHLQKSGKEFSTES